MAITQKHIDQAFSDLRATYGGVREDYFGLLYLEREFDLLRESAALQVAFGGSDYGIDGFHIEPNLRNLYLLQFKWSTSPSLFKQSFQRLIDAGMERVFGNSTQDQNQNQMLLQLRTQMLEKQALIDRVFFHFVFNGDPAEAERSQVLDKLREDLEGKKYLIDAFFGRQITMGIQFRSATKKVGPPGRQHRTHTYPIEIEGALERSGPGGELMRVGFVRLVDLHSIYADMGPRFFERNIRAGLGEGEVPNRAIAKALKQIVLDGREDASVFAFNHNGVTIYAEKLELVDGQYRVTEPRLLNGAQTVTTFDRFLRKNESNPALKQGRDVLQDVRVLCKFITSAKDDFVVAVTINNNRQNPVMPWNLRANDMIQLALQDLFREELRIYYERQENAFANLTQQDLEDLDITEYKAVELLRLAQTFLASDGEIDKLSRMREVFENDNYYDQVFNSARLSADPRKIVLCYKIQFRLRRLIREIMDKGASKYTYMARARNLIWALICQGILNDLQVEKNAERFGKSLIIEADFTEWLAQISSTRARFLIKGVVEKEPYASYIKEERYDFLRTRAVYEKCMDLAYSKWKWTQQRLK